MKPVLKRLVVQRSLSPLKNKIVAILLVLSTTVPPTAQARYYDPEVGRFLSADEYVQNVSDPQTLNRYAYVRNKPTSLVDPDGHLFWVPIMVGAALGAYSAGQATNWNSETMFKGALVGAIGGAVGAGFGNYATSLLGNAFVGGILGGAAGGAASGYSGAAMFGGNRGIAAEQGAKWGGMSGGVSQGMTMAGVPDLFSQTGSSYLTGHWEGGAKAGRTGAAYAAVGQVMGNALTMAGVDSDGVVPEEGSIEHQKITSTNDTYVVTPEITTQDGGLFWMTVALLTNGTEHTWHAKDQYVPSAQHGGTRYYRRVNSNVAYTHETPSRATYDLFRNNCTTRLGSFSPASYYSKHNFVGPSVYWGTYEK